MAGVHRVRRRIPDVKNLARLFTRGAGISPGLKTALDQARRAEDDWRLEEALVLWAGIRERYANRVVGHAGHAAVLAKLNRCEEALADLTRAIARFPDSSYLAVDRVRITQEFGDFDQALRLSEEVAASFPNDPHAPELLAKSLRSLLRFDEADAVLEKAREVFPHHIGIPIEYTASADMRGDYVEGLRRSQALLNAFPNAPIAHASVGAAFKRLKRYDEADQVLVAAMARFPDNSNLAVNYAWVADDKADWQEALRRWSAAYDRFGREPRIRTGFLESRSRAELARIDEVAGASPDGAPAPAVEQEAARGLEPSAGLLTRFESLGENCEFGFVQRHFGAEPLGLLRWAGISFDKLLVGLESSFEGVGGPERTRMDVNPHNQEYFTRDTLYGFDMHTFMLKDEANEATIYKKMGRRLEYLKNKLLDDLAAAEKVFVFQTAMDLCDDDLRRLHAAIRLHGPGRLLAVRLAREGQSPGDAVLLQDGLAAGYVDRVGFVNNHWNISFGCWSQLCRGALALFESDAPQP